MIESALSRLRHQIRTDCLHLRFGLLVWWSWLVLRHWQRGSSSNMQLQDAANSVTACLGVALVYLCVRADPPSNPETSVLTRPLGRHVLWLAKALFILCLLILPWIIAESLTWRGFDHPPVQWCALTAGALLTAGTLAALVAFVAAWTRSGTQMFLLGVAASAALAVFSETDAWMPLPHAGARDCGDIIASVVLLGGLLAATWLCFVPRRQTWALVVMSVSIIQQPFTEAVWPFNWLRNPPASYPKDALTLKVLKADPNDKTHRQHLWPKIRLHGLARDEVATVLDFAPILPGKPWPGPVTYTDLSSNGDLLSWLRVDHFQAIKQLNDFTALWSDQGGAHFGGRPELPRVFAPWKLDKNAPPPAARLRLAIHRMRPVATLPLRELWEKTHRFIIHPGLRVEVPPFHLQYGNWRADCGVQRQFSRLLPDQPHARIHRGSQPLIPSFILVLHDPELREVEAHDFFFYKGQVFRPGSHPWQFDENRHLQISLREPEAQLHLLQRTKDEWIDLQTVTLWHVEERGTVELDLTAEQMAELLAEPMPEPKKP
jgi:hypothetical protein